MDSTKTAICLAEYFGLNKSHQASIKPIGSGHINNTFLLSTPTQSRVVQKLNSHVFPQLDMLVNNARLIEQHLMRKQQMGRYQLAIIRHVLSNTNEYLIKHDEGSWRALVYIEHTYSEDVVADTQQAYTAANAFGQFAAALADFDAQQLHPVIPDFHNLAMRVKAFQQVVSEDNYNRVADCQPEIDFCLAQLSLVTELAALKGDLPIRACHNDTKINNMLFCNTSHQAKAVIDLDTCMAGYWLFDFGDMVRTFCSPEPEDSPHLSKVTIREDIFLALAKGYIEPLKALLTKQEKQSFWLGTKVMTFMIGLRFLTDYLDGDNYFAITHPIHNLHRAQNQFALYKDILAKKTTLQAILSNI
jgi:hypothetical protein